MPEDQRSLGTGTPTAAFEKASTWAIAALVIFALGVYSGGISPTETSIKFFEIDIQRTQAAIIAEALRFFVTYYFLLLFESIRQAVWPDNSGMMRQSLREWSWPLNPCWKTPGPFGWVLTITSPAMLPLFWWLSFHSITVIWREMPSEFSWKVVLEGLSQIHFWFWVFFNMQLCWLMWEVNGPLIGGLKIGILAAANVGLYFLVKTY